MELLWVTRAFLQWSQASYLALVWCGAATIASGATTSVFRLGPLCTSVFLTQAHSLGREAHMQRVTRKALFLCVLLPGSQTTGETLLWA